MIRPSIRSDLDYGSRIEVAEILEERLDPPKARPRGRRVKQPNRAGTYG
jgi:hypothetical protein